MLVCFHCGAEIETDGKVGRSDACPKCKSALKCCKNCRFYDRNAHNQCLEPAAEWVSDKERSNFCEYFEGGRRKGSSVQSENAKKKWDSLFNK